MIKEVLNSEQLREATLAGVDRIADAVKTTLGPKGRNAVLPRPNKMPFITNDGVTIAKMTYSDDDAEYMGVKLIREVSQTTNDKAGDGTTTATVLAQHMMHAGYANITAGANQVGLKNGLLVAAGIADMELKKLAKPVSSRKDIEQIATISSGDPEIGAMIGEVMERNGLDASINIKESKTLETKLEIVKGMQFGKGFISEQLLSAKDKLSMTVQFDKPYILVTDEKIEYTRQILPILEKLLPKQRPIVLICGGLDGEALSFLTLNIARGILKCMVVEAPSFGDQRALMLQDIAAIVGAQLITEVKGVTLFDATEEMMGTADSIKVTKDRTAIMGGKGDPEEIKTRIKSVRGLVEAAEPGIEKERLQERLASISGGVSMIQVGAASEVEAKEKMLRIEDAVQAARAAMAEGILPGGGTAYMLVKPAVEAYRDTLTGDKKTGASILVSALEVPMKQIAQNAGVNGDAIVERFYEQPAGYGFDADSMEWKDMIEAGIVDPCTVSSEALLTAASLCATLLTADAGVVIKTIEEEDTY